MTGDLREELRLLAATAPTRPPSPDLWERGRRARRRGRVAVATLAVATTIGIGALTLALPTPAPSPDPASSAAPGVPDRIHEVPARLTERSDDVAGWAGGERIESDLAIGPGAAAFLADDLPVVVTADDGAYHLLDLPGYLGANRFAGLVSPAITLSPSGRYLAYSWATFGPDAATEPIPSGVKVLDLVTGAITGYRLPGSEGTAVSAVAWSPDERWLGWVGDRQTTWTAMSMGSSTTAGDGPVIGRIALASSAPSRSHRVPNDEGSVSVSSAGLVRFVGGGFEFVLDDAGLQRVRGSRGSAGSPSTASPTDAAGRAAVATLGGVLLVSGPQGLERIRLQPAAGLTATVLPLAWAGRDLLAVTDDPDGRGDRRLALISPTGDLTDVGRVDGDPGSLSVAGDLVTAGRPVVARPAPDWPSGPLPKATLAGIAVLGGAVLLLAGRSWLSRRRRLAVGDGRPVGGSGSGGGVDHRDAPEPR